jgi:hypothetical protein
MSTAPKIKPTLKPITSFFADGHRYGVAEHRNGDHTCHTAYREVREGENLVGLNAAVVGKDGSYEMVNPGTEPCSGSGPAQVATESYRNGWEATFRVRGGVS